MNRFAELLDRLAYEPGRNNKLRLLTAYFRETDDPDRGYALAALTGALSFKHAKPGLIRDLITDRADPVLFGLSYDYVGDLSETVALMWPKAAVLPSPRAAVGRGRGWGVSPRVRLVSSLLKPPPHSPVPSPPLAALAGGGEKGTTRVRAMVHAPLGHNNPPPPTLTEVVTTLRTLGKTELPNSSRAGSTNSMRPAAGRC